MTSYQPEYEQSSAPREHFWRNSRTAVPGRLQQTNLTRPAMSSSSFHQFQASVSDAWDAGDDEVVCGIADARISKTASQTAALNVINSHRNSTKKAEGDTGEIETNDAHNPTEVKKSGPVRAYPGRPRPVKLSALSTREESSESRIEKFEQLLESSVLDLDKLKQLSWSGIPGKVSSNYFLRNVAGSIKHR